MFSSEAHILLDDSRVSIWRSHAHPDHYLVNMAVWRCDGDYPTECDHNVDGYCSNPHVVCRRYRALKGWLTNDPLTLAAQVAEVLLGLTDESVLPPPL